MKLKQGYLDLKGSYLFLTVAQKRRAYEAANPGKKIISLGIGDVTRPICKASVEAMKKAAEEMGNAATFRGYGEYEGYSFLTNAIAGYYKKTGANVNVEDIFVGDGAKNDIGNILDIFDSDNTVMIPDPVYPVYVDTNFMDGRRIVFCDGTEENGFLPMPDRNVKADIIYICSPNNPTGAVYTRDMLKEWVDFANANGSVIIFDAAYEAFITSPELPRSIFEIDGARSCAIEFCSLSKTAGFTGIRSSYTVVPKELERCGVSLNAMWMRHQSTKYNGCSYIIQRGTEAVFSDEGLKQSRESVRYYLENAGIITGALDKLGIDYTGGKNSPYVWMKCPNGMTSWEFFDFMLEKANVVGTPGSGFGKNGEGRFRLTSFGNREQTLEAVERLNILR